MTRDEAVDIIKGRLARSGNTAMDDYVIGELKLAQTTLEEGATLPWFLLTELSSYVGTIGEERVPVPDDFLMECEEGSLWIVQDDGTSKGLPKDDYAALLAAYSTAGTPISYALLGEYFRVLPVPTAVETYKRIYYGAATALTTNIENVWLKHSPKLMIGIAGEAVARYVRDFNAVGLFKQDASDAWNALVMKNEARLHSNREYMMGDD